MADRVTYLDRRLRQLDNERRRVEDEIASLTELGDDVYPDDSVLLFRKHFGWNDDGDDRRLFTYVALKAADRWWLTGRDGTQKQSWNELVRFLSTGVTELWEASAWKRIS